MEMPVRAVAAAREALHDPAGVAARWRSGHQGPVIAHLPYDVPVELIHAAGALPVGVFPSGTGGEHAQAHLQGWICSPARRFLTAARQGELEWADGLIIPQICDTMRGLKGLWQFLQRPSFLEAYYLPRTGRESALPYLTGELTRLRDRLGEFSGRTVEAGDLFRSITLYNAVRTRLDLLFQRHVNRPAQITNLTWYTLVRASFILPPEEMLPLLDEVLAVQPEGPAGGVPLVVSGQLMEPLSLAGLLDASGVVVVGDDLVDGQRACQAVPEESDPLAALARRAWNSLPCAAIIGPVGRETYLADLVRERRAVGVIFLHFRNCEMENLGYPGLRDHLERRGIPTLYLETQWGTAAAGSVATRLEAFREMLEGF